MFNVSKYLYSQPSKYIYLTFMLHKENLKVKNITQDHIVSGESESQWICMIPMTLNLLNPTTLNLLLIQRCTEPAFKELMAQNYTRPLSKEYRVQYWNAEPRVQSQPFLIINQKGCFAKKCSITWITDIRLNPDQIYKHWKNHLEKMAFWALKINIS